MSAYYLKIENFLLILSLYNEQTKFNIKFLLGTTEFIVLSRVDGGLKNEEKGRHNRWKWFTWSRGHQRVFVTWL
jgi:hypothetical protein